MAFLALAKSGTLSLNERMGEVSSAGRKVYRFGFGESPFPVPDFVQAALHRASPRKEYTAVAGLPELRERIAAFHQEADGYAIHADQVLVAPGSKPLLYSVMQAFSPGDFYAAGPSWVSYVPQARIARHAVHRIPTSYDARWRVRPAALDALFARGGSAGRQKLLVLNYPGNPDGLTYSRPELEALAQVLRRHKAWVISDEIYALLDHRGAHVSLASIYPERTLVSTGLSKWCGAGGWRLGALILPAQAPPALKAALIGLGSEIYSCAPVPIQLAALAAYDLSAEVQAFLNAQRRCLRAIGNLVHQALLAAGIRAHAPQGGFYLLLDFSCLAPALAQRGIVSDSQLCERLLEELGLALLPGSAFGMEPQKLTARLAYVDFDGEAALATADNAEQTAEQHAAKMLEGIRALARWLH